MVFPLLLKFETLNLGFNNYYTRDLNLPLFLFIVSKKCVT